MFGDPELEGIDDSFRSEAQRRTRNRIIGGISIVFVLAICVGAFVGLVTTGNRGSGNSDPLLDANLTQLENVDYCESDAASIIASATGAGSTVWNRLSTMCDTFGPRFSGTQPLEDAIDWIVEQMIADGLENVRKEPVEVTQWVRGNEWCSMNTPHSKDVALLGLGGSIGTPKEGITAEVLVVSSFDDLEAKRDEARGKIVLFNVPWQGSYGKTVPYRSGGAVAAAEFGAVASLVSSVTPVSLYTPHTGGMHYEANTTKIPSAAITVEDSQLIARLAASGESVELTLYMEAYTNGTAISHNVIAELRGSESPEELVVVGGHIDSWDVGQGAQDDGGGCVVSWEAVRLIKSLGLRPKRTLRVVLWTNEENGLAGAKAYAAMHANDTANTVLAVENDIGIFAPFGMGFTGSDEARVVMEAIAGLLVDIGADQIAPTGGGADLSPLPGVNQASLYIDNGLYFNYHHTNSDTMDKISVDDLNNCVATLATHLYCVAARPDPLPSPEPSTTDTGGARRLVGDDELVWMSA